METQVERTVPTAAAAALAGVSRITIAAWVKKGRVLAEREGRNILIDRASLDKVIAERSSSVEPEGEPELERAKAIINGEEDAPVDAAAPDESDPDAFPEFDGMDEEQRRDMKFRFAFRLTRHALSLRNKRQRDAERELLWLAVQEAGLIEPAQLEEQLPI